MEGTSLSRFFEVPVETGGAEDCSGRLLRLEEGFGLRPCFRGLERRGREIAVTEGATKACCNAFLGGGREEGELSSWSSEKSARSRSSRFCSRTSCRRFLSIARVTTGMKSNHEKLVRAEARALTFFNRIPEVDARIRWKLRRSRTSLSRRL